MHSKAARDTCDVVECDQPATDDFVHVEARGVLGFRICGAHAERIQAGQRPVVAADPFPRTGGRPALHMTATRRTE